MSHRASLASEPRRYECRHKRAHSLRGPSARLKMRAPVLEEKLATLLRLGSSASLPSRIAVIGNHLPRQCGIATFTTDLCDAIGAEYGSGSTVGRTGQRPRIALQLPRARPIRVGGGEPSSYEDAADFLNFSNVDLVSLQHEYGIFGGPAGSHILRLMRRLKMPVVTTLHTALREPDANQRIVMDEIAALSDRLIVMSEHLLADFCKKCSMFRRKRST